MWSGEVCFVDTETLGLDPDINPMWEVGLIDPQGQEFHWFLQVPPRALAVAHPVALEIGKFGERYSPEMAVDPVTFCLEFEDLTRGCHLAGAVVSFDEERLRRMFYDAGINPGWHYHLIDVEAMAVGALSVLRGYRLTLPWDSTGLSQLVGVDPDAYEKHTAIGDARWARDIYQAVVNGPCGTMVPSDLLEDVAEMIDGWLSVMDPDDEAAELRDRLRAHLASPHHPTDDDAQPVLEDIDTPLRVVEP